MEKPPVPTTSGPLEQFILLSKTAKGAAAAELIRQLLEAPGVYVFGELLEMPHIRELAEGPHSNVYNMLNLFAYGTYSDYKADQHQLPALSPMQSTKLRHLTIISLATKSKCLPYSMLLKELDMRNLRELEDLIIEAIYADIIRGKLDQKHQQLEVDFAIGRDIRPEHIQEVAQVLEKWCAGCETLIQSLEKQVTKANDRRGQQLKINQDVEQELANIKKTLKAAQRIESDEQMVVDSQSFDKRKPTKAKSSHRGAPAAKSAK